MNVLIPFHIILVVCLLLFSPGEVAAQEDRSDEYSHTFIHAGYGVSSFGPTLQAGLTYRPDSYSISLQLLSSFSGSNGFSGSTHSLINLLYSRGISIQPFSFDAGLGLSAVFVSARPGTYSGGISFDMQDEHPIIAAFDLGFQPDPNEVRLTAGFPLELQARWHLTPRLVWAVHTFVNVNRISTKAGVYSTLQWRLPRP